MVFRLVVTKQSETVTAEHERNLKGWGMNFEMLPWFFTQTVFLSTVRQKHCGSCRAKFCQSYQT